MEPSRIELGETGLSLGFSVGILKDGSVGLDEEQEDREKDIIGMGPRDQLLIHLYLPHPREGHLDSDGDKEILFVINGVAYNTPQESRAESQWER